MLKKLYSDKKTQRILALVMGIIFGFLLQKGGVAHYHIIIKQLLLKDFTVAKIIMTAIIIGMPGIYTLKSLGIIKLHPKDGSVGKTVFGSLIFGVGFAILGYCPGTIVAAAGQGNLDAMIGGIMGIIVGAAIYSRLHIHLNKRILKLGNFGDKTIPEILGINPWFIIIPFCVIMAVLLYHIESLGL